MRTARMLPRSSVTLSVSWSGQWVWTGHLSGERRLWEPGRVELRPALGKPCGRPGRVGHGRRTRPAPDAGEGRPQRCGPGRGELDQHVPDDPRSVPVGLRPRPPRLLLTEVRRRLNVYEGQAAKRPGKCLLDVRAGVAHELADERQRMGDNCRIAPAPPLDERDRGDRRADQASLPARAGVHKLLELGPAIRLEEDAP